MSEHLTALQWFKSSHSGGTDGNSCVEVALAPRAVHIRDSKHRAGPRLALAHASWAAFVGQRSELDWFKSTHSGGNDGNSCVEIALAPRTVHVRDSKHPAIGPILVLRHKSWTRFLTAAVEEI
ncbi:DUF397 domain-containing protein [Streptomyces seoulensis]|uniref:DUF397 domain-containing protein n=1 Tax=Streptomyces seoulensis TaxID=73044 RepID=UPI003C2CB870